MPRDPTTARLVDPHVSLFRAALVAAWAADESAHPGKPWPRRTIILHPIAGWSKPPHG
jgi:hypothetical protein